MNICFFVVVLVRSPGAFCFARQPKSLTLQSAYIHQYQTQPNRALNILFDISWIAWQMLVIFISSARVRFVADTWRLVMKANIMELNISYIYRYIFATLVGIVAVVVWLRPGWQSLLLMYIQYSAPSTKEWQTILLPLNHK